MGFRPLANVTQAIDVTGSSAATTLTPFASQSQGENIVYEIQNAGSVQVACVFGAAGVTTTFPAAGGAPGGYIVQPGQSKIVDPPQNTQANRPTTIALIGQSAGPTRVYITPGVASVGG
jgi:hypothetical protein